MSRLATIGPLVWRFARDRGGVSATEFAMVAPVLALVLAGTLDIGAQLYSRFGLNAAVNAGANYAIVSASSVTSSSAGALSDSITKLVSNSQATNWAKATAVVNNGPTSVTDSGTTTRTGATSPADSCYCPTMTDTTVTWGSAVSCGSDCANGSLAGKFVLVQASKAYTPLMGSYSFAGSSTLTAQTLVQVQ